MINCLFLNRKSLESDQQITLAKSLKNTCEGVHF